MKQSAVIECPSCEKQAMLVETVEKIPHFGEIIITTVSCDKCGFRFNDVMSANLKEPAIYTACISSEKDLYVKVVKSSSGFIELPEFGLELEPGAGSQGFITNAEGILNRFEEIVSYALKESKGEQKANAEKILENIKLAKNGKFKFCIKVKDPYGNSFLIGEKVEEKKLSKKEIEELSKKGNVMQFESK